MIEIILFDFSCSQVKPVTFTLMKAVFFLHYENVVKF